MLEYQVPCHTPSFKTVFIKHAAVLDQLCNQKQAISDWSTSNPPTCCCKDWKQYKPAALNLSDDHWVLSGSLLHSFLPPALAVIAEGSLSNKVFPSTKGYLNQLRSGFKTLTKRNGLPSMPASTISELGHHLWQEHCQHITHHITKSSITQLQSTFEGAVFHCEDKHASSLRIYCPCLYYQAISTTFQDPSIFEALQFDPTDTVISLVTTLTQKHGKGYPWAVGAGPQLTTSRLHLGKTVEGFSKWATNDFIRGITFPTDAQHPCPSHLPTHSGRMSTSLCHRRRLHSPISFEVSTRRCRSDPGQPGPSRLLH